MATLMVYAMYCRFAFAYPSFYVPLFVSLSHQCLTIRFAFINNFTCCFILVCSYFVRVFFFLLICLLQLTFSYCFCYSFVFNNYLFRFSIRVSFQILSIFHFSLIFLLVLISTVIFLVWGMFVLFCLHLFISVSTVGGFFHSSCDPDDNLLRLYRNQLGLNSAPAARHYSL